GIISTKTKLDYESQNSYTLNISLSDGNATDYATVFIKVTDVNDNNPVFAVINTTITILENMPAGTVITSVSATDVDEGFNGLVVYTLKGGEGKMDINTSGSILLEKELDREKQDIYNLMVIASDQGQPVLSTVLNLTVIIDDVNDNPPIFSSSRYEVGVSEDEVLGRALLTVFATDLDAGANALVKYRIVSQQPPTSFPVFLVNLTTGQLSLSQQLDYETIKQFEVEVEASDGGQPSLIATTRVVVHVLDVNDNPPEFNQASYDVFVFENLQKGSPIYTFSVTDKDEVGTKLTVILVNENDVTFFINLKKIRINGTILVNGFVDRESKEKYELLVVASDNGVPQRQVKEKNCHIFICSFLLFTYFSNCAFSESCFPPVTHQNFTYISVQVLDVNDNPPRFTKAQYSASVHVATAEEGVSVVSVSATDPDVGNNSVISYSLSSYSDHFHINNCTGEIILSSNLGHITADTVVTLIVIATDHGIPPLTSNGKVTVRVNDVNDNPPVFSALNPTKLSAPENAPNLDLGVFSATDMDIGVNALITYSLQDDFAGMFYVNNSTGKLVTKRSLDREMMESYELKIIATDSGKPPQYTSLVVSITVEDENDNPPVFPQKLYSVTVKENESPHVILSAAATDEDIGYNAVIHYTITGDPSLFHVGVLSGNITVLQPLDYESHSQYTFILKAFNPGEPHMQDTANITGSSITVEDVNEEGPVFDKPSY
ncbi:CELR3 protein, partial [Psilopogon haemacephalus]|nr:CELR3 protein [Psilopogon haemacephalus]